MLSDDPKRRALVTSGFSWVPGVGVWLNEEQSKIVSSRAVQEWDLDQLLAFIRKPTARAGWAKGFSRST